ncbi:RagB/SusD family nutrient uptake outer membrane protein [Pedobacter sp. Du54]|uniref:RagB/SusD family nutrient uptake outer membrane protein n=1 Tax=Pedobacter anseongensis TaxID=3133439 RepID=UPI00309D3C79
MKTIYSIKLLAITCVCVLASCKKFTQTDLPSTQLASSAVFQSDATAQAALGSLYVNSSNFTGGSFYSPSILGAQSSDETDNWSTSLAVQQVAGAQLIPSNSYSTTLWGSCYQTIYYANAILEGTEGNPSLSAKTVAQLQGEALFFRALAHLTLTGFFGKVPIVLSTDYSKNNQLARSTVDQVLASVVSDLEKASPLLEADYAVAGGERIRANRFAAKLLLARTSLYQGNWVQAENYATDVVNSSQYGLVLLNEVFLKNSKETVLALKPFSGTTNSGEGNIFVITAKPTYIALRKGFYDGFESGDQRKTAWTAKLTTGGTDYYYPAKYKVKNSATVTEYSVILRLAEAYLVRSEARIHLDKLPLAIADLDMLRARAALPRFAVTNPGIGKDALLEAVLMERRSELFTEWAHRWIDLKRFAKNSAVLSPIKPGYQPTASLYPVPQSEININKNLEQNPGY